MSDRQKYEPIAVREFKSSIPAHLLGKLSDSERYMVETMSKLENQSDWLAGTAQQNRHYLIDLDGRVQAIEQGVAAQEKASEDMGRRVGETEKLSDKVTKLWDWKTMMSGKWAVLWALLLIVFSAVLKYALDIWMKKGP